MNHPNSKAGGDLSAAADPLPQSGEHDPTSKSALDLGRTQFIAKSARAGNRELVEELYRRVAPAVYTWAHLRMSPALRRRIDPQEVVQEVWCRALTKLPDFDPEQTPFRPWIFKISHYVLIEMTRKLPPRVESRSHHDSGAGWTIGNIPDTATGASTILARTDALEAFIDRVQEIGPEERELLILRGLEGKSFREVAQKIGSSEQAVGKRWQRLRAHLAEQGPPDYLM